MLYEISHLRQSNRSLIKRWFTSTEMDLFVWYHNAVPVKFQLSYNKKILEHAISWDTHQGFQHYRVDSGESIPSQYKRTPLLIDICKHGNLAKLARQFLVLSENIDIDVADFIYSRLMAYPALFLQHNAAHTNQHAVS